MNECIYLRCKSIEMTIKDRENDIYRQTIKAFSDMLKDASLN